MPYQQFREMSDHDRRALVMLGAAVRIARHRMGLTQRQLAERTGVSQTAISRMECGKVWGMAIVMFARVAWALEERWPLGGCPHFHLCDHGARWRQLMAEHVALPVFDMRELGTWDPRMDADEPSPRAVATNAEEPPAFDPP
jgi:DNA-binding XRE family transcriptional regulator